jgi:hypothetical protein
MVTKVSSSLVLAAVFTIITMLLLQVAGAQVMTSPSYQLQSDSINIGGGYSSSTNYVQESTVGEIATGPSDSTSFSLRAGYQQMQEVYLSLSAPTDVVMSPNLGGLTGGTSNGSTTVTVLTDSPAGYQMTIEAEGNPAMQLIGAVGSIADYSPAGAVPDTTFTITATDSLFGFSPTGNDIDQDFQNVGAGACDTAGETEDTEDCWDGLSTTARTISESTSANHPSGATTTVHFRVGIGGNASVPAGVYIATTTLTAYPL